MDHEDHSPKLAKDSTTGGDSTMQAVLLALVTGVVVGVVFSAVKLPLPAPPVLAGVSGIVGIYLGGQLFQWIAAQVASAP